MILGTGLIAVGFALLAVLAVLTVPLAACVFFAALVVIWLNPHALPPDFFLEHGLAIRLNSPALISIPLFGLAGELAVFAGVSDRLLAVADAVARRRMGIRTILGCALFATVSGVGPAAVTAEGKRLAPAMTQYGYSKSVAAGAIACAAVLSIIIPASVPLTVYAATVGLLTNMVFAASFVPGLLVALALFLTMCALSHWRTRRGYSARVTAAADAPAFTAVLYRAKWAILMPALVLGFLFTGFLTAPEAAAFSSAYALFAGWRHGVRWSGRDLLDIFGRAATGAAIILMLTAVSGIFTQLVSGSGAVERFWTTMYSLVGGKVGSILFMNFVLLLSGCILDMPAIITIVVPFLLPMAELCRMSVPHFGVVVVLNIAIGLVTPPQAWNLAAASTIVGVQPRDAARGAAPFLAVMVLALTVVSLVPELSLWFPRLFGWPV